MAQERKTRCIGLLAHVDAGKTTLAEAMLYLSGTVKKLGRVDHRDSFLDTHRLERQRGITIFSKQARLEWGDTALTLLDTPGHADFSTETERTLRVLDAAVLVISGTDGVQAHTETLWRLLRRYRVPCFLFVSKMDLPGADEAPLVEELRQRLDGGCVDFTQRGADFEEQLALCSEAAMERYLAGDALRDGDLNAMIAARELFPCFFGSGLRLEGVEELLDALDRLCPGNEDGGEFAARVYKIARDAQGQRLSFMKMTGGELSVRSVLKYCDETGEERQEKLTQLRLYSGEKYETVETVHAGEICAALGLSGTWPGQGLGAEADASEADVQSFTDGLSRAFNITPWTLLVPVATGVLIALRMPSLAVLFLSALAGGVSAVVLQSDVLLSVVGEDAPSLLGYYKALMTTFFTSTHVATGSEALDRLVSTRGMSGMLTTVWLILCAVSFGGVMYAGGMLRTIADVALACVRGVAGLVGATAFTGALMNVAAGDQYISILITSDMFRGAYRDRGLEPRLLSRTIEDSSTVTSVLVPWNTCAMAQSASLGMATVVYLPFCFFNIISPFMSVVVASLGWKIVRGEGGLSSAVAPEGRTCSRASGG